MPPSEAQREEFEDLLEPHLDLLFGYALRMTRDRNDAEDLLQESIFRGFRGMHGFRRGTNFKAWMFRIVTNTFISRRRSAQRAPALMDVSEVQEPEAAVQAEIEDAHTDWSAVYAELVEDDVKRALDELPEEFRAPLLLSSLGGLRYKEIAEALQIPVGTVMSRLYRARHRLRHTLRDYALQRGLPVTSDSGRED